MFRPCCTRRLHRAGCKRYPGLDGGKRHAQLPYKHFDPCFPFQELLRSPLYSAAVEESLPRIVTHAASVLRGVKERGRMVGDIMDAATEEALKPQVRSAHLRPVVNASGCDMYSWRYRCGVCCPPVVMCPGLVPTIKKSPHPDRWC